MAVISLFGIGAILPKVEEETERVLVEKFRLEPHLKVSFLQMQLFQGALSSLHLKSSPLDVSAVRKLQGEALSLCLRRSLRS